MFSQNCNLFEFQRSKKSLCSCTLNGFLFWLNDFYVFWYSPYYGNAELIKIQVFPPQNTPLRVRPPPSTLFFGHLLASFHMGGKSRKFWEISPPDYRFSLRKLHFRVQNCQNFRLRRANEPHTFGVGEPAAGGEKIDFWRSFWWIFMIYFPPIIRTHGGEIFTSPPYLKVMGGKSKKYFPPIMGGGNHPLR